MQLCSCHITWHQRIFVNISILLLSARWSRCMFKENLHLSRPCAKRGTFWRVNRVFFTKTAVNPGTESQKLLLTPIKIRTFGPKTAKFGPKSAFLVILGQILWLWLWRAGCISQDTYLLYCIQENSESFWNQGSPHTSHTRLSSQPAWCSLDASLVMVLALHAMPPAGEGATSSCQETFRWRLAVVRTSVN